MLQFNATNDGGFPNSFRPMCIFHSLPLPGPFVIHLCLTPRPLPMAPCTCHTVPWSLPFSMEKVGSYPRSKCSGPQIPPYHVGTGTQPLSWAAAKLAQLLAGSHSYSHYIHLSGALSSPLTSQGMESKNLTLSVSSIDFSQVQNNA